MYMCRQVTLEECANNINTFVSANLYFLSISIRTILACNIASLIPMHCRGPAPNGM